MTKPIKKHKVRLSLKKGQRFKIDTFRVFQYTEKRVVSEVTLLNRLSKNSHLALCQVDSLRANCLIPISNLKPI